MSTAMQEVLPADVQALERRLDYLPAEQVERVRRAYQIGAQPMPGRRARAANPTSPIRSRSPASWPTCGMDVETIVAAILHDTLEDTPLSRSELVAEFGETGRRTGRRRHQAGQDPVPRPHRKRPRKASARCCWRCRATCA